MAAVVGRKTSGSRAERRWWFLTIVLPLSLCLIALGLRTSSLSQHGKSQPHSGYAIEAETSTDVHDGTTAVSGSGTDDISLCAVILPELSVRIVRELHDSVSQNLPSCGTLRTSRAPPA